MIWIFLDVYCNISLFTSASVNLDLSSFLPFFLPSFQWVEPRSVLLSSQRINFRFVVFHVSIPIIPTIFMFSCCLLVFSFIYPWFSHFWDASLSYLYSFFCCCFALFLFSVFLSMCLGGFVLSFCSRSIFIPTLISCLTHVSFNNQLLIHREFAYLLETGLSLSLLHYGQLFQTF